ncbi:serine/threonine protein kinase [bacterium]|nr:serine/threonine protein kinase [bacterium]
MSLEDNYEIESPLYVGQVATAYPAIEKALGRKVLLKVMHSHWAQDEELLERFKREGQALAKIEHPNIVKAFSFFIEDGLPCLTLEWIEGGTLADSIKSGPLSSTEVKRIAEAVLSGLSAVHNHGLLHRDLKPDNILLGKDGRIVLADFSLAGFENLKGLTGHGALVGSPAYMAPELIEGKDASQQSDLWGLGIILLEALTGSNPYAADDPLISLEKLRTIDPLKLQGRTSIDSYLAGLIDALLQRNPELRPKDAAEAGAILRGEIQPSVVTESLSVEISESDETKKQRNKRIYIPVFVVFILIIISAIFILKYSTQTNEQTPYLVIGQSEKDKMSDSSMTKEYTDNGRAVSEVKSHIIPQAILDSSVIQDKVKSAFLTLIVLPWAYVAIDGEEVGVTPLGTLELEAGDHELMFSHTSYPQLKRNINLVIDERDTLRIDMSAEAVQLNITAIPWGYLWIDSDSIGILPRNEAIWTLPGKHQIVVIHPKYKNLMDSLYFEKDRKLEVRADFINGTMVAIE